MRFGKLALCALFMLSVSLVQAQDLVTNGGFESNGGAGSSVFTGWTVTDQAGSFGSFYAQTGQTVLFFPFTVPPPPEGTFAAMTAMTGFGSLVLIQNFVVPYNVTTGTLNFQYVLRNYATDYFTGPDLDYNTIIPNQQARVDILTGTAGDFSVAASDVLFNAFQTNPSDLLLTNYNSLSADVTSVLQSHGGETLRLRFTQVDNQDFFYFGVDAVSLQVRTAAVPEPGSLALLAGMSISASLFARRRKQARKAL